MSAHFILNDMRLVERLAAEFLPADLPASWRPSHFRLRSNNRDQYQRWVNELFNHHRVSARHIGYHADGREFKWVQFTVPFQLAHHGSVTWLEMSPPNPEHLNGLDAIIFRAPADGDMTRREARLVSAPEYPGGKKYILQPQVKGAEELLGLA